MLPACHKCGFELRAEFDYGRQDHCQKCGVDTHVCLNCKYYDPSHYNECTEPVAERVLNKEKANFCDYFKPSEQKSKTLKHPTREDFLKTANALFKKKGK